MAKISEDAAAIAAATLVHATAVLRAQRQAALGEHDADPESEAFQMYSNAVKFIKDHSEA